MSQVARRGETSPKIKRQSVWTAAGNFPASSQLNDSIDTDVCIIGAGMAGLSTGHLLTKAGRRVVIVDDGSLAGGMTQLTTAHLSNAIDDRFVNMEKWHGADGARLAAESHAAAIQHIEDVARELEADCDFRRVDGYLFCAPDDDERTLDDELAAAKRAGVDAQLVGRAPLSGFETGPAIQFSRQARFHPYKYLSAVAAAIVEGGGRLFTGSHVDKVEPGEPAQAIVGKRRIRAQSVVVATNSPINDMFVLHTKQAPYMTYVIAAPVPKGSVADALYWDTQHEYHYVRLQEGENSREDLLIIGGEDHKSGQADAEDRHARLETWARLRFPMMGKIAFTWGGQCMETVDGLAFIGRNPSDNPNMYVVTGDSGMGITHGAIAGLLLTDLILGRENPWAMLYDPSRKPVRAMASFVTENLNVAAQYTDWIKPGEVDSTDEIASGCGAVVRRGAGLVAAYRDDQGTLTELSAACPHLGCVVHWNNAERSWDCPCHGSRFRADGQVINGPANVNLSPAEQ